MDLKHHFHVPSGIDETWAHFQDVAGLAGCFPGASVAGVEGDSFTGSCKVKLGPIALVYNGAGTFTERDENAHRLVVEAKGKDKRGNGTAAATAALTMSEAAAGGTDVEVVTDLAITGKPAQFGRGLIQDVSEKLLGQFVGCLEQQLSPSAEDASAGGASAGGGDAGGASAGGGDAGDAGPALPATAAAAGVPGAAGAVSGAPAAPSATGTSAAGAPAAPRVSAAATGQPPTRPAPPAQPEALDLGATVLPVLIKSYWKPALAGVLALAVLIRLLRRR